MLTFLPVFWIQRKKLKWDLSCSTSAQVISLASLTSYKEKLWPNGNTAGWLYIFAIAIFESQSQFYILSGRTLISNALHFNCLSKPSNAKTHYNWRRGLLFPSSLVEVNKNLNKLICNTWWKFYFSFLLKEKRIC